MISSAHDMRRLLTLCEAHEDTEAFRRWFGNSKVVSDGKPRVVYHGTKSNFDAFRDQKTMAFGPGYYFTGIREEAVKFAVFQSSGRRKVVPGANVMPVYLRIENPREFWSEREYFHAVRIDLWDAGRFFGHQEQKTAFTEQLKRDGHDGIIIHHRIELRGQPNEYVVFSSNQVKSAIGNVGTFSADDDRIIR